MSTTMSREDEDGTLRRAQALDVDLAGVVRQLAAQAGRREVRSYHALLPILVLIGVWMALERYNSIWADLSRLPERFVITAMMTLYISIAPILLLIAPTEIIPPWRAARVRRRFAPPPAHLPAAERCETLVATLEVARAALRGPLAKHVPERLLHD